MAALLLGACNGGRGGGAVDTTLPPRATSTSSTAPDYSVPPVIDVAYVEKVMAALDHVYGDAIRILARERKITQDFLEHLAAIYTPKEFEFVQGIWVRDVAGGLQGLLPTPGDPETTVLRVTRADRDCVIFAAQRSFAATRSTADRETPQWYIALVPKKSAAGETINPTPWMISFDGFIEDGREPSGKCTD